MAVNSLDSLDALSRYLLFGLMVVNIYLITTPTTRGGRNQDSPTIQDCFDCIILWPTVVWLSVEGFVKYIYRKLVEHPYVSKFNSSKNKES